MSGRKIETLRVFACGMTESGKDYLLGRLFLERAGRVLIMDPLDEHHAPAGVKTWTVHDLAELRKALGEAARSGPRWRVIAKLPGSRFPDVAALLVPEVIGRRGTFPQHVGGMALMCSELDLYAPTHAPDVVTGLWRRGRHVGLSVFAATQRPHGVSRSVTASSSWIVITRTQEPRDLRYLEEFIPAGAYREVLALEWLTAVLVDKRTGAWYVLDRNQKIVRRGRLELSPAAGG